MLCFVCFSFFLFFFFHTVFSAIKRSTLPLEFGEWLLFFMSLLFENSRWIYFSLILYQGDTCLFLFVCLAIIIFFSFFRVSFICLVFKCLFFFFPTLDEEYLLLFFLFSCMQGPQYVCTNFWTFVCTTCSGIQWVFSFPSLICLFIYFLFLWSNCFLC